MKARNLVVGLLIFGIITLGSSNLIMAEKGKADVDMASIVNVLNQQAGKQVELVLRSGEKLSGTVAKVDDDIVRIEKLAGKDFYDAVVRIKAVDAVIYKAREK